MLRRIFIVGSDLGAARDLARSLVHERYSVSIVSSFEDVCALAAEQRPDLVITSVRLGPFNGLHLAARFRDQYPGLPMIVLGEADEIGLAADTVQLQARFVPSSTPRPELLSYINDLLAGRNPKDLVSTRRWPRRPCVLAAHTAETSGHVVNAGYGGLCLKCDRQPAPNAVVEICLPTVGINVTATSRWSFRADEKSSICGFELDTSATDAKEWRRVVDALAQ